MTMAKDDTLIDCTDEVREMVAIIRRRNELLKSAAQALRSYQYGNAATELAKEVADAIDQELQPSETA